MDSFQRGPEGAGIGTSYRDFFRGKGRIMRGTRGARLFNGRFG